MFISDVRARFRRRSSCPEVLEFHGPGASRIRWSSPRPRHGPSGPGRTSRAVHTNIDPSLSPVNTVNDLSERGSEKRAAFLAARGYHDHHDHQGLSTDSATHGMPVLSTTVLSWREYCTSTAIHGLRYIVDEGRSKSERFFWIVAIAVSLLCCTLQILKTYDKWDSSAVIVSFSEYSTPLWQVPFPAVTVCPKAQPRQSKFNFTDAFYSAQPESCFENFTANFSDTSPHMLQRLEEIALLCDDHILTTGGHSINSSNVDFLREVAPQLSEVVRSCKWQGSFNENCTQDTGESLFTPIVLDAGICYSFNLLNNRDIFTEEAVQHYEPSNMPNATEWDLENGYVRGSALDAYPWRALSSGTSSGLFLLLRGYKQDLDVLCRGPGQGFKILLHNPAEIPSSGHQQFIHVPFNQDVVVVVKASMMTTSEGLRGYEPSRRLCYFPFERKLRFFKVYTRRNCELECSTNFTMSVCGCAAFHMPRTEDMPICGVGSSLCRKYVKETLVYREMESDQSECRCLPECNSLQYGAETSHEEYDWEQVFQAFCRPQDAMGENVSLARVSIYFKDFQIITSRRKELVGLTDFLADCGGLLGLFSGFSIISLIEIAYYVCIRTWCNFWRQRGNPEESTGDQGTGPDGQALGRLGYRKQSAV